MKRTFTGKNRIFLAISGVIILVALVMQICGAGINLGIDFTGGSLLTYSVGESYDVEDVYTILKAAGYDQYQVTKTEPSEASNALRAELAAQAAATPEATLEPETTAEAAATDAAEATQTPEETAEATQEPEATEEPAATEAPLGLLNPDKSGIAQDSLTDLQIRLDLVDETAGLEDQLASSVKAAFPEAKQTVYHTVTSILANDKGYDQAFVGGFVAEYEIGADFDTEGLADTLTGALTDAGYSVADLQVVRYDAAAEAAAEATAEPEATVDAEATAAAEETADTEATAEPEVTAEPEATEEPAAETGTSLRVLVSIDSQTTQVRNMIETEMRAKYPDFVFVTIDHVSAVAGKDLISNAVKALLIAFACMLVYIAIRFDFYSGVVALGALVHDVLIMCSFMVFFRGVFQANSPFIAAVLTIVGYSINNTIIIFDRIRENAKKPGQTKMAKIDIVEMSVSATLSRTVNTTITTMITLVCLFIFGVDSIREFAFPLIVGMVAGTYSSLLLSGQVWAAWVDKINARKAARKGAKKA
ncbi:MAG: protein translocase subunit SecF [Clostridiales bacterium]|nr:protein translocase subunit SecF [Clostridiales bacterium]MDD6932503.1 protein translocase subunit SecF [Eubacteriales bacterium]